MALATFNKQDMETLGELVEAGKLTTAIDRSYPLSEIADALAYIGEGHARGKIVVTVD